MALGSVSAFLSSGTSSVLATTTAGAISLAGGGDTVVVTNASSSVAFVRFGIDQSVSASSLDMPVLANSRVVLSVNPTVSYASVVLVSGTGTVFLTRGSGSAL
jgi:hypothetical protein